MQNIPFIKMHGLGNDFVIIDSRSKKYSLNHEQIRLISDRHTGVGCDQLVLLEASSKADCFVRFYNADGSQSGTCGNATRCVAHIIMQQSGKEEALLESVAGLLECKKSGNEISVNMGKFKTNWQDIPLARQADTLNLNIGEGALQNPVAVSMGNPHAVFFVDDAASVDLQTLGPILENDEIFPQRANISAAQIVSNSQLILRVWERGTGQTLACGSGACAAAVAAYQRNLTGPDVSINLEGGNLQIKINDDNTVVMTGPVATSFSGEVRV